MRQKNKVEREITDCPTAWFAALERARRTGNVELEAEAIKELTRLGVRVQFSASAPKVPADQVTGSEADQ